MFSALFIKECKQILKSFTYYLFLICLIVFFVSQISEFKILEKPLKGQENYGTKYSTNRTLIMKKTINKLANDYVENNYITYPIGFYKQVKLREDKKEIIRTILTEATGLNKQEISQKIKNYHDNSKKDMTGYTMINQETDFDIQLAENFTYSRFMALMKKVDKLVGGGSAYNPKLVKQNAVEPLTYEEALKQYNDILYKDKVTNAYARIFCDYLGIVLAILPVFLAVTRGLRDKRASLYEVIYAKSISSNYIILSRYLSTVLMVLLPVLLIGISSSLQTIYFSNSLGVTPDYLAFFKHIGYWLLPTILITTSVGFFITEFTNSALGILVQGIWWIISIFGSISNLVGSVGFNLVPRFNTIGDRDIFVKIFPEFIVNRIFYSVLAVFLIGATIFIYEMKRKGVLNSNGTSLSNWKSKHKA